MQKALVLEVAEGDRPNVVLELEHPSIYTIGRLGDREDVCLDESQLVEKGLTICESDRGGQVTYHGPGQLVVYPILDLRLFGGPLKYVRALEQVLMETLAGYGIEAQVIQGLTGVWVGAEKIASIGVKISRGVSHHGLSLNINTDLSFYRYIVPCGITDKGVTSMEKLLGERIEPTLVAYALRYNLGERLGMKMVLAE